MSNEILTGEFIKLARENKNITQQELADHAGVTKSYISQIESNKKKNVKPELMNKICEILGLAFFQEKKSNPITIVDVEVDAKIAKLRADFQSEETEINKIILEAEILYSSIKDTANSKIADLELLLLEMNRKILNYSDAYRFGIICSERFSQKADQYSFCCSQFEVASMDMENGSYFSAIERYKVVEGHLLKIGIQNFLLHRTQVSIALIAIKLEKTEMAHEYINRAKDNIVYLPDFNKERFRAVYDFIQAKTLFDSRNFKDSIDLFNSSYYLFRSINDNRNALRMKHNLAEAYLEMNEINQAIELAREVYEIKQESPTSMAITSNLLGKIYLKIENHKKVYDFCLPIIADEQIDPVERVQAYILIARAKQTTNDLDGYTDCLKSAISIAKNNKNCEKMLLEIATEYIAYIK